MLRARLRIILAAFAIITSIVSGSRPSFAWVEAHVDRDDVRITLDRSGGAKVEHRITLRIAGGPLPALDVRGVDPDAVPEADGYVAPAKEAAKGSLASAVPAQVEVLPQGVKPLPDGSKDLPTLRVRLGDRGLGRGVYLVLIRYSTRLLKPALDGAMTRITWRGPTWDDGLDTARVIFDLPAGPSAPRSGAPSEEAAQRSDANKTTPLVLSNVRRGTARDEIELVRPYIPKGESTSWSILADPRVLANEPKNALDRDRAATAPRSLAAPAGAPWAHWIGLAIAALYAAIVALKARAVARTIEGREVTAPPIVPLPAAIRAPLAGLALTAGVWLEIIKGRALAGAFLVLAASLLAAYRPLRWTRATPLRGPGKWLPITDADAFRDPPPPPGGVLDVSSRAGKLFAITLLAALVALAYWVEQRSAHHGLLLAADGVALLAIVATGRARELPPDPAVAPSPFLRRVAAILRASSRDGSLRVAAKIRVPEGSAPPDELRLAIALKGAPKGFLAIEIGVVFVAGAGGPLALPSVLVRFTKDSPCEEALAPYAPIARASRGRKQRERVLTFSPRFPTVRTTAALALRLVANLMKAPARLTNVEASERPRRAA